jgi:hypothetical protein
MFAHTIVYSLITTYHSEADAVIAVYVALRDITVYSNINPGRAKAHQGTWRQQRSRNFPQLLLDWVKHVGLNGAGQIEVTATQ